MNPVDLSFWEKYGPVGVIAGLAVMALAYLVRRSLDKAEARGTAAEDANAKERAKAESRNEALHAQVIAFLERNRTESETAYAELEQRHAALFERFISTQATQHEKLAEVAAANRAAAAEASKAAEVCAAALAATEPHLKQLAGLAAAAASRSQGRRT